MGNWNVLNGVIKQTIGCSNALDLCPVIVITNIYHKWAEYKKKYCYCDKIYLLVYLNNLHIHDFFVHGKWV